MPRRGEKNSSAVLLGSAGKDVDRRSARRFESSAAANAWISTTVPRDALIERAPGFIRASWSAPII